MGVTDIVGVIVCDNEIVGVIVADDVTEIVTDGVIDDDGVEEVVVVTLGVVDMVGVNVGVIDIVGVTDGIGVTIWKVTKLNIVTTPDGLLPLKSIDSVLLSTNVILGLICDNEELLLINTVAIKSDEFRLWVIFQISDGVFCENENELLKLVRSNWDNTTTLLFLL